MSFSYKVDPKWQPVASPGDVLKKRLSLLVLEEGKGWKIPKTAVWTVPESPRGVTAVAGLRPAQGFPGRLLPAPRFTRRTVLAGPLARRAREAPFTPL